MLKSLYTCESFSRRGKCIEAALASVAQLVGHHPANQKVASPIPGLGTCLGCRFDPQSAIDQFFSHTDVYLSFSLPSSLSKNK